MKNFKYNFSTCKPLLTSEFSLLVCLLANVFERTILVRFMCAYRLRGYTTHNRETKIIRYKCWGPDCVILGGGPFIPALNILA